MIFTVSHTAIGRLGAACSVQKKNPQILSFVLDMLDEIVYK